MNTVIDVSTRWRAVWILRVVIVAAWVAFGMVRLGVDRLDRFLVAGCWEVPSLWNAVAEVAIKTGVIDPHVSGVEVDLRRASIHKFFRVRYAIITLSDLQRSHIYVMDGNYQVVGRFRRQTSDALLVTDKWRGLQPLSHLWPVYDAEGDGRLSTLIGFSPVGSARAARGTYAYISLGPDRNEVLFVCHVETGGGRQAVLLAVEDISGDGHEDLVVYPAMKRGSGRTIEPKPLATFRWDAVEGAFRADVTEAAGPVLSYWCSTPGDRVSFGADEWMDESLVQMLPLMTGRSR